MKGGALQVARSVFEEAVSDNEISWYFAINKEVYHNFEDLLKKGLKQEQLIILQESPARNKQIRRNFTEKVRELDLDAVFTLFGPAYIKFPVPHLCGIADGWVTHATKEAFQLLPNIKEKIRVFLLCRYKLWWYQKADRWCVEAEIAKEGYKLKSRKPSEAISVIPNAVNQIFQEYSTQLIERKLSDKINIFCFSSDYWHKNHQIIPDIISSLKQRIKFQCNFVITLPPNSTVYINLMRQAKEKGVEEHIINLGAITLKMQ